MHCHGRWQRQTLTVMIGNDRSIPNILPFVMQSTGQKKTISIQKENRGDNRSAFDFMLTLSIRLDSTRPASLQMQFDRKQIEFKLEC